MGSVRSRNETTAWQSIEYHWVWRRWNRLRAFIVLHQWNFNTTLMRIIAIYRERTHTACKWSEIADCLACDIYLVTLKPFPKESTSMSKYWKLRFTTTACRKVLPTLQHKQTSINFKIYLSLAVFSFYFVNLKDSDPFYSIQESALSENYATSRPSLSLEWLKLLAVNFLKQ